MTNLLKVFLINPSVQVAFAIDGSIWLSCCDLADVFQSRHLLETVKLWWLKHFSWIEQYKRSIVVWTYLGHLADRKLGGLLNIQSGAGKSQLAIFVVAKRKDLIALNKETLILTRKHTIGRNF